MFTKVSIYLKCDNYLYYNFRIHHFGLIHLYLNAASKEKQTVGIGTRRAKVP